VSDPDSSPGPRPCDTAGPPTHLAGSRAPDGPESTLAPWESPTRVRHGETLAASALRHESSTAPRSASWTRGSRTGGRESGPSPSGRGRASSRRVDPATRLGTAIGCEDASRSPSRPRGHRVALRTARGDLHDAPTCYLYPESRRWCVGVASPRSITQSDPPYGQVGRAGRARRRLTGPFGERTSCSTSSRSRGTAAAREGSASKALAWPPWSGDGEAGSSRTRSPTSRSFWDAEFPSAVPSRSTPGDLPGLRVGPAGRPPAPLFRGAQGCHRGRAGDPRWSAPVHAAEWGGIPAPLPGRTWW